MAARTASVSGNWNNTATWGGSAVPVSGDTFTINAGVEVLFNVDQSAFATGLGASVINGILHFDADTTTCLKMNGNLTGTGALYVCERAVLAGFALVEGKTNTYSAARTLDVAGVEETVGAGYTEVTSINLVESTASSFYYDSANDLLYIHTSTGADPSGFTITVLEPINRPAVGQEYRTNLRWTSTGTLNVSTFINYAWTPTRLFTTLTEDADINQPIIVLEEDLGLQQGDIIVIGSGTDIWGYMDESQNGAYTVLSYVAETKTVTLTGNLGANRLEGDYVSWYSRPIKYSRTSGTSALTTSSNSISNFRIKGVFVGIPFLYNNTGDGLITIKHCTSAKSWLIGYGKNVYAENCVASNYGNLFYGCSHIHAINCVCIIGNMVDWVYILAILENCVSQNYDLSNSLTNNVVYKNCEIKTNPSVCWGVNMIVDSIIDCSMDNNPTSEWSQVGVTTTIINSDINLQSGYFPSSFLWKAHNCTFNTNPLFGNINTSLRDWDVYESFDHNRIPGNYYAVCKGGTIETVGVE